MVTRLNWKLVGMGKFRDYNIQVILLLQSSLTLTLFWVEPIARSAGNAK